jgi:hypothetical protein
MSGIKEEGMYLSKCREGVPLFLEGEEVRPIDDLALGDGVRDIILILYALFEDGVECTANLARYDGPRG